MMHRATSTELQGSRYEESSMGGLQESKCRRANAGGQHGARVMGQRVDISWGWWGGGSCSGGGEAWRRSVEAKGGVWLVGREPAKGQSPRPRADQGMWIAPPPGQWEFRNGHREGHGDGKWRLFGLMNGRCAFLWLRVARLSGLRRLRCCSCFESC